ncbi:MAG: YggT family protein, partial [Pseudomonadota bacterium]
MIIDFYAIIIFCRFLLQLAQADFYNPASQMIVRLTQPV